MSISVVIPTLDEARYVERAVASARGSGTSGTEVLVVDGGSRDATVALARAAGARVLQSPRGRARQLRRGQEEASGEVLVFLHADTRLPEGWRVALQRALADPATAGGAFTLRFTERGLRQRGLEAVVAWRATWLGWPYGDQALFVRRSVLEAMGGIPIVPMLEDLDLVRGIRRAGRLVVLPEAAETSSRRYLERGFLRTMADHALVLGGELLGLDRARLARWTGR